MPSTATDAEDLESPANAPTLVARGVIALALSITVNLLARSILDLFLAIPPEFQQFSAASVVVVTALAAIGATLAYAFVANRARDPVRTYRRMAVGVLVLSFAPDVGLWINRDTIPGLTAAGVLSLMLLHVAAFFSIVGALTWSPATKAPGEAMREKPVGAGARAVVERRPVIEQSIRLFRQP